MARLPLVYLICAAAASLAFAVPEKAGAEGLRLAVPPELAETGLMRHMLPRFSLKHRIPVDPVPPGSGAEAALGRAESGGAPAFAGPGGTWHIRVLAPESAEAARFADWLLSEVGARTVTGFMPDGAPMFTRAAKAAEAAEAPDIGGDAQLGMRLSLAKCGRCHAVDDDGRKKTIGSTPSFFVLRGFADWEGRFLAFYALKPHPAFTQVAEVTEPFPEERPPPIVPVEVTLEEIDAILAYVAGLQPADLGAPLELQ